MFFRHLLDEMSDAVPCSVCGAAIVHQARDIVNPVFRQMIPHVSEKSYIAVTVDYLPDGTPTPHVHAMRPVIYAYVISGAIESKASDGEVRMYRTNQSWSEPSGALLRDSRNASKTQPAKLLAICVVDSSDKAVAMPVE